MQLAHISRTQPPHNDQNLINSFTFTLESHTIHRYFAALAQKTHRCLQQELPAYFTENRQKDYTDLSNFVDSYDQLQGLEDA